MTNVAKNLDTLETLLTKEQDALRTGKIMQLADLDAQKADVLEALSGVALDETETVIKLRKIAKRNHELMEAVHSGVKAARERFEALLAAQKPMTLYGPKGQKSELTTMTKSSVEKRT